MHHSQLHISIEPFFTDIMPHYSPNNTSTRKVPMSFRDRVVPLFLSVLAVLMMDCAGQVFPSGGPVDTTPPTIIRTVPDSNAIHVQTSSIVLEFSKYVDRRSVEESIFISPFVGKLEFEWSGREVTINFAELLQKNTTYVVNVGTDVIDLRASNRMAAGFTLAFSSGDSIDRGYIAGRVFDEKSEGVMVFAYRLDGINPDTLNPGSVRPDVIMQVGKGGTFAFSHIAPGTYRLIAVRDEFRNLIYDKEIDAFGVPAGDITLSSRQLRVSDVWFRLSKEDTTRPFLTSVAAQDRRNLQVRFSEALDSVSFLHSNFTIVDTVHNTVVPIAVQYLTRSNRAIASLVLGAPMDSGVTYKLRVQGVADRAGNHIDPGHASSVFLANERPDTMKPRFDVVALRDSIRGVFPDQPIEIDFSEPVLQGSLVPAVVLRDSTRRVVPTEVRWLSPTDIILAPRQFLMFKAWYALSVRMDSVVDLAGNRYRDSLYTLRFQTLDLRTTGTIEGVVIDQRHGSAEGPTYVNVAGVGGGRQKSIRLAQPGRFSFDQLPQGAYIISCFVDRDSSGTYSFGSPYPFIPSERFGVCPDTVKVRARWGVEGVEVKLH